MFPDHNVIIHTEEKFYWNNKNHISISKESFSCVYSKIRCIYWGSTEDYKKKCP